MHLKQTHILLFVNACNQTKSYFRLTCWHRSAYLFNKIYSHNTLYCLAYSNILQWGSEIRTCPDFEWRPDFEWQISLDRFISINNFFFISKWSRLNHSKFELFVTKWRPKSSVFEWFISLDRFIYNNNFFLTYKMA